MFKIVFKNIKNYGFLNFFLIVIFELFNLFKFKKFDLFYDQSKTNSYNEVRRNYQKFNSPYLPTPFYILNIIDNEIRKFNLNNYIFIDFGCGA
jgi:hypothetical protein